MPKFGGENGNIDYAALKGKRDIGERSGTGVRRGNSSKTEGISTTDTGDTSGYAGTIKDTSSKSVADASGWGR